MRQFTRIISFTLALTLTIGLANAQNLMTKAQTLGLKTSGTVNTLAPADVMSTRTMLLEEGFDFDFPPADWTIIDFNTNGNNWIQTNPENGPFSEIDPTSLFSAMVPWVAEDQDEWLITPEINAGGEAPLKVEWYAGVSGPWIQFATLKLHISTDGGTTWTELWNAADVLDPDASWAWNFVSINLDDYADAPFWLGWQYVGNDGDLAGVDGVVVKSGNDYIYETDFEEWTAGTYLVDTDESGFWTTWSDAPGTAEDAFVVDELSNSPSNSVKMEGTSDLVFKMGDKTSGAYQFNVMYYIEPGNGGYINLQHYEAPGIEWAVEVYFGASTGADNGYMFAGDPTEIPFTFTHGTLMQLEFMIDLDNDWAEFYIDDVMLAEWQFSLQAQGDPGTLQLGGANIYSGAPTGETPLYYFDDLEYIVLVEGTTPPIMDVDDSPVSAVVEIGDTFDDTFGLGNIGVDDLNYDITVTYPMGNKAMDKEPTGVHAAKDLNAVLSVDPTPSIGNTDLSDRDVTLNYDGDPFSAIGTASDYQWRVAARFPSDLVEPYIGMEISSVDVYINDPGIDYKLQIYDMGEIHTPGPGELLLEQTFVDNGAAAWVTVTLDSPIYIEGGDIWVGYWVSSIGGLYTPGCDEGPVHPDGDWMASGPGWGHLSDNPDLQYNWNIRANLTGNAVLPWLSTDYEEGVLTEDEMIDVTMTLDASDLESDIYNGDIHIRSNDPTNDHAHKTVLMNVVVGVDENGTKQVVSMYPNPASDYLQIASSGEITSVRIVNTIGQVVYNQNVGLNRIRVSTDMLPNGVYFVNVETANGIATQKVIIE
ncbi:MAG: hypothetical protein C0598_06270 [Marinilabiliales bacterium]|nr:MAG: hypothetical protein C0598_06270 [Marinilabiliales bacterium]